MIRTTFRTVRWFRQRAGELLATRACLVAILFAMATVPARAEDAVVEVRETQGVYDVTGRFEAAVPLATAWAVLSDYEHIDKFVKSMRASAFVRRPDGSRVLRQDAVVGVFLFHHAIRVELALHEEPRKRIAFRDELGKDFSQYSGSWTLHTDSTGTRVDYALHADPRAGIPRTLGRGVMAHSAKALLTQVRQEMIRRAGVTRALADSAAPR